MSAARLFDWPLILRLYLANKIEMTPRNSISVGLHFVLSVLALCLSIPLTAQTYPVQSSNRSPHGHFRRITLEDVRYEALERSSANNTPLGKLLPEFASPSANKEPSTSIFPAIVSFQPIPSPYGLRSQINIARAAERVAVATSNLPTAESIGNAEQAFYRLLIAQKELESVKAKSGDSNGVSAKVQQLTAALDKALGLPTDTILDLVPPEPEYDDLSLEQATIQAMNFNLAVVAAEQNVVKAKTASELFNLRNSNTPHRPDSIQAARRLLFDFGDRVPTTQSEREKSTEFALQLTKMQVADAVEESYFRMERARQLSQMLRGFSSAAQLQPVSKDDNAMLASRARLDAEIYKADAAYLQSLASLKVLMGSR